MKTRQKDITPIASQPFYISGINGENDSFSDVGYLSLNNSDQRTKIKHGKGGASPRPDNPPRSLNISPFSSGVLLKHGRSSSVKKKLSSPSTNGASKSLNATTSRIISNSDSENEEIDSSTPSAVTLSNQRVENANPVYSLEGPDEQETYDYSSSFNHLSPDHMETENPLHPSNYGISSHKVGPRVHLPASANHSTPNQVYQYPKNPNSFHQRPNHGLELPVSEQHMLTPDLTPASQIQQSFSTQFFPFLEQYSGQSQDQVGREVQKALDFQHPDQQYNFHLHNHFYKFDGTNNNGQGYLENENPHIFEKKDQLPMTRQRPSHKRTQSLNPNGSHVYPSYFYQKPHSAELVPTSNKTHKHQNSNASSASNYSNRSSIGVISRQSSGTTIDLNPLAGEDSKSEGHPLYPHLKPKVATTFWDDEKTICYQVEGHGILVSRREDTDYVNGTKLLNVAGMTRGKRDGILKQEKTKTVVKVGSMNLKGVWIPYDRAFEIARNEGIDQLLYPLFKKELKEFFAKEGAHLRQEETLMITSRSGI